MVHLRPPIVAAMLVAAMLDAGSLAAQSLDPPPPQGMAQMHMTHEDTNSIPPARDASGTSWQPDETPMYAAPSSRGRVDADGARQRVRAVPPRERQRAAAISSTASTG